MNKSGILRWVVDKSQRNEVTVSRLDVFISAKELVSVLLGVLEVFLDFVELHLVAVDDGKGKRWEQGGVIRIGEKTSQVRRRGYILIILT